MAKQPEQILEEQLVAQLQKLGYGLVVIRDEKEVIAGLKSQVVKHNKIQFSGKAFEKVLNILGKRLGVFCFLKYRNLLKISSLQYQFYKLIYKLIFFVTFVTTVPVLLPVRSACGSFFFIEFSNLFRNPYPSMLHSGGAFYFEPFRF